MNKPTKIRIGQFDFEVRYFTRAESDLRKSFYGGASKVELYIEMCGELPAQQLADTFIHEVLHGIFQAFNIKDDGSEEDTVCQLSGALMQVWRDNPEALDWWKGLL